MADNPTVAVGIVGLTENAGHEIDGPMCRA